MAAAKKPVPVPEGMVSIDNVEPEDIEVEEKKDMSKVPGGKAGGAASGVRSAGQLCLCTWHGPLPGSCQL